MAVEARHLNLFPPQSFMMNGVEGVGNVYASPIVYGAVPPLAGTAAAETNLVPVYGSGMTEAVMDKTAAAIKAESGLTYAFPVSRKRSRDSINPLLASSLGSRSGVLNQSANNRCGSFTFLGEDFSHQFQQQQLEIDHFIAQHTEKVRIEIQERRKRYSRLIAAAMEDNIMKKLKSREEEIDKIGKLNWALEERVKSLCMENQIWRDLAQTNEATANALRCNLEQVLAQVQDEQQEKRLRTDDAAAALADDAQSCCGSNFNEIDRRHCTSAESRLPSVRNNDGSTKAAADVACIGAKERNRLCRSCGKEESCVLLLPCRHLCLCTVCGSSRHTCPVCNSPQTASVHVNLSAA